MIDHVAQAQLEYSGLFARYFRSGHSERALGEANTLGERDRRIEDLRDGVLIAAVTLAETPADDEPEEIERARRSLLRAIDYLEEAVLRFGFVNRAAARLGYGAAGDRVWSGRSR